ncbi:uncharacterized protein METZ01_LOCUS154674 [marine metagenome]|uniref:Uncharacterized protein n=1 Tax=marine metagenome TaxID=408172 RepID=A0A382AJS2_9ZZZZ
MKQTIKNIWKSLSRVNGNSLAEFATVSALMATLAATAAPKLSEMSEGTKGEKSGSEIDKILTQAGNFYQATADTEGRGRFPGQEKYNCAVGGYGGELLISAGNQANSDAATIALDQVYDKLNGDNGQDEFNSWDDPAGKWRSVFGISNSDIPDGHSVQDDDYDPCDDCVATDDNYGVNGEDEWLQLFNGNALESKFQDGHFIYVVVPGGGSGLGSFPPVIVVADLENPHDFNNSLEP